MLKMSVLPISWNIWNIENLDLLLCPHSHFVVLLNCFSMVVHFKPSTLFTSMVDREWRSYRFERGISSLKSLQLHFFFCIRKAWKYHRLIRSTGASDNHYYNYNSSIIRRKNPHPYIYYYTRGYRSFRAMIVTGRCD